MVELLREYMCVFSRSYQDIPGLDTDIVEHRLPLKLECLLVKQKLRRTHPNMAVKIKEEVKKQIDVRFLVTAEYPLWVANIVPVPKKDDKVWIQKGNEVDPDKVRAIQEMPAPKTKNQVRGFLERLNYISIFISHITAMCGPIFKLLRKDQGCV
ncbi:uncharacterized protein LOC127095874 [Lathyrus oleraceus]|uniref:uncharacterized protein LOC127095874 n=1 Tax=Pisum sativum TaxID=3888 RepID=UPI0021D1C741|nr:uncharacterized protein LOC127095874 [Pisum sativum]